MELIRGMVHPLIQSKSTTHASMRTDTSSYVEINSKTKHKVRPRHAPLNLYTTRTISCALARVRRDRGSVTSHAGVLGAVHPDDAAEALPLREQLERSVYLVETHLVRDERVQRHLLVEVLLCQHRDVILGLDPTEQRAGDRPPPLDVGRG
uniref:Pco147721a n=1 Tax=Arundo donax TaxID=35708 RepID=A0A0A9D6H3_ARUDO